MSRCVIFCALSLRSGFYDLTLLSGLLQNAAVLRVNEMDRESVVVPDWRWSNLAWYPSGRVFRQSKIGEWRTVIDQAREALRHQCGL
jgi:hypothetical protein